MSENWYDKATCRGMDTELWFTRSETALEIATGICLRCPVREACLQSALDTPNTKGVWGGLTEIQRSRLGAKRARTGRGGWTVPPAGVSAVNAAKTRCKWGHEFTEENTAIYGGKRYCRTCSKRRIKETRSRQRKAVEA
jgi:WhiB family redox-sensing transcriptional regulator